jgi:hypothetical protein
VGICWFVDFDRVADELYALSPGEFVPARDQLAATARAEGDVGLSAAIKKLRKPTTSAWLANLVVRERAHDVHQLIELGSGLRVAQHELAGQQLRDLSGRRHEVVTALRREGQGLGRRAGVAVNDAALDELEGTLEAAIADPDAAVALRSGRLTSALRYAGTGLGEVSSTAGPSARPRPGGPGTDDRAARPRHPASVHAESAAKGANRRASAAKQKVAEVSQELNEVRSAFDRAKDAAERLEHEMVALEERVAEAQRQLRDAEGEERAAHRRLQELQAEDW